MENDLSLSQSQLTLELSQASEALSKLTAAIHIQHKKDPTKLKLKVGVSRELSIINRQLQRLVFNALSGRKLNPEQKSKKDLIKEKRNKDICDKLEAGTSMKELSKEYGLSVCTISLIALAEPNSRQKTRHARRKAEVSTRLAAGEKAATIAKDLGITTANVYSIHRSYKKDLTAPQKEIAECPPKTPVKTMLKPINPHLTREGQVIETVWRFPVKQTTE